MSFSLTLLLLMLLLLLWQLSFLLNVTHQHPTVLRQTIVLDI